MVLFPEIGSLGADSRSPGGGGYWIHQSGVLERAQLEREIEEAQLWTFSECLGPIPDIDDASGSGRAAQRKERLRGKGQTVVGKRWHM